MKASDFLKILESFPGQTELRKSSKEELISKYSYIDFEQINRAMMRKNFSVNIPANEEVWFKFLAFEAILMEYLAEIESFDIPGNEIFGIKSLKIWERIREKFNEMFQSSPNIILGIGGISLEELIEFSKSGKMLL